MRKILLSLLMIFTVCISGCSVGAGSVVTYHNNDINNETSEAVKILDDKVLESLKKNEEDKILEISSEVFKKDSGKLKEMLGSINEVVKDKTFDYKDRYYCKISKVGKYNFTIGSPKEDPFYINLAAVSKEIYVSLIKSSSDICDYMLSLVYIKEKGEWKLYEMSFGDYSYGGMAPIDLYNKAISLDKNGYKVPAALYSVLSNRTLHPAPFLQYKKEKEITDYSKKLLKKLNDAYVFPKKLENTKNIKIQGFDVRYVKEGVIPVVKYITDTGLSNQEDLIKEANAMNNEVTGLYTGMKESFKYVLYEAYSEPPVDPKITYKCYRTIVEQK